MSACRPATPHSGANDVVCACDHGQAVWEGFKPHLGPEMTRVRDVDAIFHGSEYFFNW